MKLTVSALCVAVMAAAAVATDLPPGFESASDLVSVLNSEPQSAKESRFASVSSDSITFKDSSTGTSEDDGDAEFDSQIAQVESDLKKIAENIKESQECANRLAEQEAEQRSLMEQKQHLEKEKEKRQLQVKLEKQMRDLSEINRMSRSLRGKFAELKRTQKVIKTKMVGTRTSLQQIDAEEPVSSADLVDHSDQLGEEVASMQGTQSKILANAHKDSLKVVKDGLAQARETHKDILNNPL